MCKYDLLVKGCWADSCPKWIPVWVMFYLIVRPIDIMSRTQSSVLHITRLTGTTENVLTSPVELYILHLVIFFCHILCYSLCPFFFKKRKVTEKVDTNLDWYLAGNSLVTLQVGITKINNWNAGTVVSVPFSLVSCILYVEITRHG